jgi:excisionase family DNA binding protein
VKSWDWDPALEQDRYVRLAELARYSSLSITTLKRQIAAADHPLPAYRFGRIILVRKKDFDTWLAERETRAQDPGDGTGLTGERLRMAMALRGYPVPPRSRRGQP